MIRRWTQKQDGPQFKSFNRSGWLWARLSAPFSGVFPATADEIRFASRRDWQAWPLPGTVELTPQGGLRPIAARRDINAVLNAAAFGGRHPRRWFQPRRRTAGYGWRSRHWLASPSGTILPKAGTLKSIWAGGVSARRVKLIFDAEGPAPALFDLLLSTGEHAVDEVDNPIAGTVIYRQRERFKENTRHEITYELDQSFHTPIQYVRLDLLALEPNTRLVEVEVEALGDNLALGTLERGGNLEVVLDAFVTQDLIPLGNAQVLIDGDLSTRWFSAAHHPSRARRLFAHHPRLRCHLLCR